MRLDRLILKELIPMWFFGSALFTVLIMSAQFLSELTNLVAAGAEPSQVMILIAELVPGFIAKSLPMGMLLGSLMSMGRLSGESEIVALRAAGASVERIMVGVGAFGIFVSLLTLGINEVIVPAASKDAVARTAQIQKVITDKKTQPLTQFIVDEKTKTLAGYLNARDFDLAHQTMVGVVVITLDKDKQPHTMMAADRLHFTTTTRWQVIGTCTVTDLVTGSVAKFDQGFWPSGVAPVTESPDDLISKTLKDLDVFTMGQMRDHIAKLKAEPHPDTIQIANLEFGFWNKLALPLSALVFGLLGAPLGIRNHRTGAAVGFAVSIGIIFAYLMTANTMNIFNERGLIPAYVASFTPVVLGIGASLFLIRKRNVL